MDELSKPGFGWTSNSKSHKVVLYDKTVFVDDSYDVKYKCESNHSEDGKFNYNNNSNNDNNSNSGDNDNLSNILLSHIPAEFMNHELKSIGYHIDPNLFTLALKQSVETYFYCNTMLSDDLNEFYRTRRSNDRMLRWNIMDISPNTSFKLHAHQNIEVIYVIKGTMHELRLANNHPPIKKVFSFDESTGPNLSGRSNQLIFEHRYTSAVNSNSLSPSSCSQSSTDLIELYQRSFLINERGSIHLSYTSDDGALLLVLWSGGHGNIPLDQYPDDAAESLRLPSHVFPSS